MLHWKCRTSATLLVAGLLGGCFSGNTEPPKAPSAKPQTISVKPEAAIQAKADDTAFFLKAIEKAKGKAATIEVSGRVFTVGSLAIPENVSLKFAGDGKISVMKDAVLKVDGSVDAGVQEIFTGEGAVGGQPKTLYVHPQWFGAKGDGATDDSAALQKAADFAQYSSGSTLFIPSGRYVVDGQVEMACNVECRGTIVKNIEIDEAKTKNSFFLYVPEHHAKKNGQIVFKPDTKPILLSNDSFIGIKRNDFKVANYKDIPLAEEPGKKMDLVEGGTLSFFSSDFFSSRNNRYGDESYERNDQCQIVSPRGDVFPEFCFSYDAAPEAPEWSADKVYKKGDYCTANGKIYKSSYPSGPGTTFEHKYKGKIDIGPHSPTDGIRYNFKFSDGTDDYLRIWVALAMTVKYTPPQRPLTVNNLTIEIFLKDSDGKVKRISDPATLAITRSNMTFNNVSVSCKNKQANLSALCGISSVSKIVFNNCSFSGATYHGLGYNILQGNCSNLVFNNCISVNCRDAIAGRHGKNITVNGGYFFSIDDHYGMNYTIRDATIQGLSTYIPGYCTPQADTEKWDFTPRTAFCFGGGNIYIENCRVYNTNSILDLRGAEADLSDSSITIKDVTVTNDKDVSIINQSINRNFDFAHKILLPKKVIIENIRINEPHRLHFRVDVPDDLSYGDIYIRNCRALGEFKVNAESVSFVDCLFKNPTFKVGKGTLCDFKGCVFTGKASGLAEENIGVATGNVKKKGANVPFPLEYKNSAVFE